MNLVFFGFLRWRRLVLIVGEELFVFLKKFMFWREYFENEIFVVENVVLFIRMFIFVYLKILDFFNLFENYLNEEC